jgi:hypothetical protein
VLDYEDMIDNTCGSPKTMVHTLKEFDEIFSGYVEKKKNNGRKFKLKCIERISELFFDTVIRDMMINNVVFSYPKKMAYLVFAQQSVSSKNYYYDVAHGQGRVKLFFVFSRKGFKIVNGRRKYIYLENKYQDLLRQELDKGHIYPVIDDIILKMRNYGY